ncbi:hypothetical protein JYU34_016212 [Plutella xylostella]|uniref:Uncharacterized protein n=2 Tax=Plutella xylostella TaxID=51655 RepID=A0ABQ7Q237_PLUXY|nr:hypothetical protein JYU34_016212 [Plutella xylostella]CAG9126763.1 unnamed protein product [Plutella xylostella]
MSSCTESENSYSMWSDIEKSPKNKRNKTDNMDQQIKKEMLAESDQALTLLMNGNKKSKQRSIKMESSDGNQQESLLKTIKKESSTDTEVKKHKKKKTKDKKKEKNDLNVDSTEYSQNKPDIISQIKTEIFSDTDSRKKKKKNKKKESEEFNSTLETEQIDESYLNLRVKQEKEENRMKPSQQNSDSSHVEINKDIDRKRKRKRKKTENNDNSEANNNLDVNEYENKHEDMSIDDEITVEETRVQSPIRQRKNKQKVSRTSMSVAQSDNERNVEENEINIPQAYVPAQVNGHSSGNTGDSVSKQQCQTNEVQDTDSDSSVPLDRPSVSTNTNMSNSRRKSVSERLTFEEDAVRSNDSNTQQNSSTESNLSLPMKQFLSKKTSLKLVHAHSASEITSDDEVWAVSAPRALPAAALLGASLDVGERGRLRAAGRSYESAGRAGRVVLARGGALAAAPGGGVALRGRPGRAPAAPPAAPPAPPAAIPLPPTRLRHPLLGADYKRALKLPRSVRARLLAAADAPRRPRRDRPGSPAPGEPQEPCGEEPPRKRRREDSAGGGGDASARPRGKRRRASSGEREAEPPRAKRRKHAPPAAPAAPAGAWDNEQAIEDNLFNF